MYALSKGEKAYLRRIVINTRNDYLKSKKYKKYSEVELEAEQESFAYMSTQNEEKTIERLDRKRINKTNIENIFEDKNINKIVEALTLKEKLVLFSYYFENKTDKQIGRTLKSSEDAIRKIRKRALDKVKKKYLAGGNKNV